jgi:hypothetical protein
LGGKSKLVSVFSGNYLQAQIVKGRLESEGIPVLLRYEGAGLVYGITVDGLGEARVMVPEDLAAEAQTIVADHEYGEPEDMMEDEPQEQP